MLTTFQEAGVLYIGNNHRRHYWLSLPHPRIMIILHIDLRGRPNAKRDPGITSSVEP